MHRNRIKRCIRESFRRQRLLLPALDIVVTARPGAWQADNAVLRAELDTLWQQLRARHGVAEP